MTTLYEKLIDVIPGILNPKGAAKSEVSGFMDLGFDLLQEDKNVIIFALSHYYKHPSGDMIADPDMMIILNKNTKIVKALSYQDFGVYQEIDPKNRDEKLQTELDSFLGFWLGNLKEQGHKIEF